MVKNKEIWKDILNYEGYYQVSDLGRVRSVNRCVEDVNGSVKFYNGRVLKLDLTKEGYFRIGLSYKGVKSRYSVHRLVALTFIPNPNNYPEVNHKDENKSNNNVNNLEWCTSSYNSTYGTAKTRNVKNIRTKVGKYSPTGELLKKYNYMSGVKVDGYDQGAVSRCCNGLRPHHKGYVWRFTND